MAKKFHWCKVMRRTHFGVLKRDLNPGEVFQTDEVSVMKYNEQTYEIPSIPGLIRKGYLVRCSDEEVKRIQQGQWDVGNPVISQQAPADNILNDRLAQSGMSTTSSGQSQTTRSIEDVKATFELSDAPPPGWDIKLHWKKRLVELKKITDLGVLIRLYRYYKDQDFQKHVAARLSELGHEDPESLAYRKQPTNMPNESNVNLNRQEEEQTTQSMSPQKARRVEQDRLRQEQKKQEEARELLGGVAQSEEELALAFGATNQQVSERDLRVQEAEASRAVPGVDPNNVVITESGPSRIQQSETMTESQAQVNFDKTAAETLRPSKAPYIPGLDMSAEEGGID
jgi:hypothetical protein